jgi:hypothetical protein
MVFGLAPGTTTHAVMLLQFGLVPSPTQPLWINGFWTALTVVDPAIAATRRGDSQSTRTRTAASTTVQSAFGVFVVLATPSGRRTRAVAL